MKYLNNNKHFKVIVSWIAVLLWMAIIYKLSSHVAEQSNNLSKSFTRLIVDAISMLIPLDEFNFIHLNYLLRKNAHFIAYLILGILTTNAAAKSRSCGSMHLTLIFGVCIIYAITDEIHQLYVPGRSGQITDVLIDSAGSFVGIGLYKIIRTIDSQG